MRHPIEISSRMSAKFSNMAVICAFFVVCLHALEPDLQNSTGWFFVHFVKILAKVSVPFFFIASGFFLAGHCDEDGWWRREVRKRVRTVLLPFFIWGAIWWGYHVVMGIISDLIADRSIGSLFEEQFSFMKFVQWSGIDFSRQPLYSVTWYLRSLFLYVILSPIILYGLKKTEGWMLPPLVLVDHWGFCVSQYCPVNLVSGMTWFALGLAFRHGILAIPSLSKNKCFIVTVLVGLIIGAQVWIDQRQMELPFSLLGVTIPLSFGVLWSITPTGLFPVWLVAVSMPVYLLHTFMYSAFRILTRHTGNSLIWIALEVLFSYMASLAVANIVRCKFKKTYSALFGGRL